MATGRKRRVEAISAVPLWPWPPSRWEMPSGVVLCKGKLNQAELYKGKSVPLPWTAPRPTCHRVYGIGWGCEVQRGPSLCLSVHVMTGEWV